MRGVRDAVMTGRLFCGGNALEDVQVVVDCAKPEPAKKVVEGHAEGAAVACKGIEEVFASANEARGRDEAMGKVAEGQKAVGPVVPHVVVDCAARIWFPDVVDVGSM